LVIQLLEFALIVLITGNKTAIDQSLDELQDHYIQAQAHWAYLSQNNFSQNQND